MSTGHYQGYLDASRTLIKEPCLFVIGFGPYVNTNETFLEL